MKQFSTNYGVNRNWLCDILHNSTTEVFYSKIDKTYLPMVEKGYFGGCFYLNISLDVIF